MSKFWERVGGAGLLSLADNMFKGYREEQKDEQQHTHEKEMLAAKQLHDDNVAELSRKNSMEDWKTQQELSPSKTHTGASGEEVSKQFVTQQTGLIDAAKKGTDSALNEMAAVQSKQESLKGGKPILDEMGEPGAYNAEAGQLKTEEDSAFEKGLLAAENESKIAGSVRNIKDEANAERDKDKAERDKDKAEARIADFENKIELEKMKMADQRRSKVEAATRAFEQRKELIALAASFKSSNGNSDKSAEKAMTFAQNRIAKLNDAESKGELTPSQIAEYNKYAAITGDEPRTAVKLSKEEATKQATQEASDIAGWFSTDASDFRQWGGKKENFIKARTSEIMGGTSTTATQPQPQPKQEQPKTPAAPSESTWLAAAKAKNPGVSESELKAYYKTKYGR